MSEYTYWVGHCDCLQEKIRLVAEIGHKAPLKLCRQRGATWVT